MNTDREDKAISRLREWQKQLNGYDYTCGISTVSGWTYAIVMDMKTKQFVHGDKCRYAERLDMMSHLKYLYPNIIFLEEVD